MLEIADVVHELFPGSGDEELSTVRIQTTRPVFLVFRPDTTWPLYVIQFGSRQDLERLHDVMSTLHGAQPTLVPRSVVCQPWRDMRWVHVQSGMPGTPWFRHVSQYASGNSWVDLRRRALIALETLHAATQSQSRWLTKVVPSAELALQSQMAKAGGISITDRARRRIDAAIGRLAVLGQMEWFSQHGDFCLNNLLVSKNTIGVIDFEEFGKTAVPLHDEFGLALSLHAFFTENKGIGFTEQIRACAAPTLKLVPGLASYLDELLLHHLLWRFNQCERRPSRRDVSVRLVGDIERLARTSIGSE